MVRFSPSEFVVVKDVSSVACFGIVITGGKRRSVSLKTLWDRSEADGVRVCMDAIADLRHGVVERLEVFVCLDSDT